MLARSLAALLLACLGLTPALAADMPASQQPRAPTRGAAAGHGYGAALCPLWQPPYGIRVVPTNDWCDPTYVGSSMGLSRPSYYGTLPPPGYDAP